MFFLVIEFQIILVQHGQRNYNVRSNEIKKDRHCLSILSIDANCEFWLIFPTNQLQHQFCLLCNGISETLWCNMDRGIMACMIESDKTKPDKKKKRGYRDLNPTSSISQLTIKSTRPKSKLCYQSIKVMMKRRFFSISRQKMGIFVKFA